MLVKNHENVFADFGQLVLDFDAVVLDQGDLLAVTFGLLLLLDRRDYSPRSTASANHILVCDGQEISLLDRELLIGAGDSFHIFNHF